MNVQIKHHESGRIILSGEYESVREALEKLQAAEKKPIEPEQPKGGSLL